jgi:Brp/Blh family beta-carotene 15,15'-monooxygenase
MRTHGIRFDAEASASAAERAESALRAAHLRIALIVLAGLLPAAGLLASLSVTSQLALVALPIAILGVMHGALDPWVGDALMAGRDRAPNRIGFVSLYLSVMAVVVGCWVLAPLPTLIGFLLISVLHFGEQDARALGGRADPLGVSVFGAIPVFGPIVGHPAEVALVFDWLTGLDAVRLETLIDWISTPVAAIWLVGAGMVLSRMAIERIDALAFRCFAVAVLVASMILLPPLIAFAAYFCLLHSFGHLFDMAARGDGPWRDWTLGQWTRRLWPATLATLALGVTGWLALSGFEATGPAAREALARIVFCGLAALTVPHVVLHELYRHRPRGRA